MDGKVAALTGFHLRRKNIQFVAFFGIRFHIHAPKAKTVQVVGDFNNWKLSKGATLDTDGQGGWFKVLHLKPGAYQYRFVVDGRWRDDPNNPNKVKSAFGGMNSVIEYNKQKETQ